ncbi:uncharacterized protein [Amphiura filiformis]|uniref:uncharacterized protein n=1 Tax=Amphiura filiformis TaxID=82378 RepID=UPI003B227BA9
MKGDREVQLDNQPSPIRVLRGSRNRRPKTSNMTDTSPHSPRRKSLNDNSNISTSSITETEISLDSGYSSQNSGEQFLMDFNMQCPQVLMTSPVRRRRPSGNSVRSKRSKNQRYALNKRKSLPVIFEQEDAAVLCSPTTPPPRRKSQRNKIKRRPSSVADALIGASYNFPGARRKGSTVLLDRNGLKKRISTLADGVVSGGATIVPVVPATGYNGSRQNSEVYSVIPRKTHLPRYGFIIQRNPYTPPPSNRRRLSTVTICGYPHQVHVRRQQSTLSIDEINKKLTQAKLERKDSKVQFSVVEDAGATPSDERRDSIANKSDGTASQVAESVYSPTGSESESETTSSGSDSSSSEWTTDSSDSDDSGSDSDSDSDTDSSYTTSSSSTSTSSDSSSDDSSSDGSSSDSDSSDEDDSSSATSRSASTSRSTFYTTDGSDATSICESTTTDASSVATNSVATGVTDNGNKTESPSKSRTSSRSSKSDKSKNSDKSDKSSSSSSRSSSSASNQTASTESRRLSALSRSSTRSSFRSSSSSPIKSKKSSSSTRHSSRSSSLQRSPSRTMSILSDVINSVSPKSTPSIKRRDSKRSKQSKTDENNEKHKSEKSERKKEKAERRKSNSHLPKENGALILKGRSGDNASVVSTPSVIVHKAPEKGTELPPNNMSTTCVIL